MAVTKELIFASEAHANAAIAVIDAAKGLTGGETWDIADEIENGFWRIAKPDDGTDSGISNLIWTQDIGYSKKRYLEDEDGGSVDDDGNSIGSGLLEDENGSPLEDSALTYNYNASFYFNGIAEKGNVADVDELSFGNGTSDNPFTVAMWVKPDDITQMRFFAKNLEYRAYCATDDKLYFQVHDSSTSGRLMAKSNALTSLEGSWSLLFFQYDPSAGDYTDLSFYVNDGAAETMSDMDSGTYVAMENTANNFTLNFSAFTNSYTPGDPKFSYVAVFNRALDAGERAELYNSGELFDWTTASMASRIISYWKLNGQDDPAGTATDYVGSNDMTFDNMDASNLDSTDYPGA